MHLLMTLLVACHPARPLSQALPGDWELWCRTDSEATSSCVGRDRDGFYDKFRPDGTIVAGATTGTAWDGTWTLDQDRLVITYGGANEGLVEEYRARMEGDLLVMWKADQGFGSIWGRAGQTFAASTTDATDGGPVTRDIGGVRYTLGLPAGYHLARDDNQRQRWEPASGDGLMVLLSVTPRSQSEVDGKWVTPPCDGSDGGVLGSSQGDGPTKREISIGTSICLEGTDNVLMCSAEQTRGYLEASEKEAGLALCRSLVVTGR